MPIIKGTEFQLHMHNLDVMVHCSKLVSLTNTAGAVSFPAGLSFLNCSAVLDTKGRFQDHRDQWVRKLEMAATLWPYHHSLLRAVGYAPGA